MTRRAAAMRASKRSRASTTPPSDAMPRAGSAGADLDPPSAPPAMRLPPAVTARVRRDSLNWNFLTLLHAECIALGRGLREDEIRARMDTAASPMPKALRATLQYLQVRGVLRRQGRPGWSRYHLPGFVEDEVARLAIRTDTEIAYDALVLACEAAGTFVPISLVRRVLEQKGWRFQHGKRDRLGSALRSLVSAPTPNRRRRQGTRPVACVLLTSERGQQRRFFAPEDGRPWRRPTPVVATMAEAGYTAARETSARLGRPATLSEIWLYIRSLAPSHPLRHFFDRSHTGKHTIARLGGRHLARFLQPEFIGGVQVRRRGQAAPVGIELLRPRYSTPGKIGDHYGLAASLREPVERRLVEDVLHLDGFVRASQLHAEVAGRQRLLATLDPRDRDALAVWLDARDEAARALVIDCVCTAPGCPPAARRVLLAALSPSAGAVPDEQAEVARQLRQWLQAVMARASHADLALTRLARDVGDGPAAAYQGRRDYTRMMSVQRHATQRQAVANLLVQFTDAVSVQSAPSSPTGGDDAPTYVGAPAHLVRFSSQIARAAILLGADPTLDHTGARTPLSDAVAGQLRACRRFVHPELYGRALHDGGLARLDAWAARSMLDHAEATAALVDMQPDVWSRSLVRRAYDLLGPITRTRAPLAATLTTAGEAGRMTPGTARRVLMAASLLGLSVRAAALRLIASAPGRAEAELHLRAGALAVALSEPHAVATWFDEASTMPLVASLHERLSKIRRRLRVGTLLAIAAP